MKHLISIIVLVLFACMTMQAQTVLLSNTTVHVNLSDDSSHVLITDTYYDGQVVVITTADEDSSDLVIQLLADSAFSAKRVITELASFNALLVQIAALEATATIDSSEHAYHVSRVAQISEAMDSLEVY